MNVPNLINDHEPSRYRQRFKIVFSIISIAISVLILRMWYLQIIRGDELRQKSENNSVRLRKVMPLRGIIMDTNGLIIVDNRPSFDVVFIPNRVKSVFDVTNKLNDLFAERSTAFTAELPTPVRKRSFTPVKLERNINMEKVAVIEANAMDIPGISIEVTPIRQYISKEMTAHIVGYTGEVSPDDLKKYQSGDLRIGDIIGKDGLEKSLDKYLRGKNGAEQIEVNVVGREIKVLGKIEPVSGYNVVLNIDLRLQKVAWEAMEGRSGSVVVMDVRDGSILALVSTPSFDPNIFNGGISREDWEHLSANPSHPMENRATSGQYPPGSTYKLIVAAAALEEGVITPETSFNCSGSYDMGNRKFRCWQKNGHGRVNLHKAIVESCDVYFYNIGKLLGADKIAEYARGFGLGSPTGIDLPREKAGLVPTKEWKSSKFREPWQMGETISISIGQGFTLLTPLQLVNAYAALANGGVLYRPRIVKQIIAADGRVIESFKPEQIGNIPVSRQNADILKKALWGVVNESGGTGYALRRKEMDVSGKTGTSQVVGLPDCEQSRRRKQSHHRFRDHALFACYAPHKKPEIAVSVIVEHSGSGGSVAAPIARKIVDSYFENKNSTNKKLASVIFGDRKSTAEIR